MSRNVILFVVLSIGAGIGASGWVAAQTAVDLRMPIVEEALAFIETASLSPISRAELLRAGALRVCGERFSRPFCARTGVTLPEPSSAGADAERAYRGVLESALAAETIRGGPSFDRTAFERFVVDGMVDALKDPRSFFLVPSIYKKIASIPSDFVGFGLRLDLDREDIEIAAVHDGSPARVAGLKAGERIVRVAGKSVTGYLRPMALCALWGADGAHLSLDVKNSEGAVRPVRLDYRPWKFVAFERSRRDQISVVRVNYFERGLESIVKAELADPEVRGLVLDLRGAGGGDEGEAVAVADLLLGDAAIGGKRTRLSVGSKTWKAAAGTHAERLDLPVAVVIDVHSTGLAELLAAALKQAARAILIGQPTAGRLTQETLRPLSDGSAVQVTTMAFTGPEGMNLSQGVTPKIQSARPDVVELAASILKNAGKSELESLVEAARTLIEERSKGADGKQAP